MQNNTHRKGTSHQWGPKQQSNIIFAEVALNYENKKIDLKALLQAYNLIIKNKTRCLNIFTQYQE